ncbi:unnamed protein product, partial [Rotaria sp. Silwood2]
LCHVYSDLIKIKTQRRSSGFNKMRLHHEAFSPFNKDHKMDKLCIRSYMKTRWLLGLNTTQIHDELMAAYGQGVVSYSTVAHWIDRF